MIIRIHAAECTQEIGDEPEQEEDELEPPDEVLADVPIGPESPAEEEIEEGLEEQLGEQQ